MDELQRYGLLSLACLVVLCLALTFKDRDFASGRPEPAARAKQMSVSEAGEPEIPSDRGDGRVPEPYADSDSARPDDVPLRPASNVANESGKTKPALGNATPGNKEVAAKPTTVPAANEPSTYTIAKSDTLHQIAKSKLGSEKRWPEIVAVNPGLKKDTLRPGQVIKMPPRDIPTTRTSDPGLAADAATKSEPVKSGAALAAAPSAKKAVTTQKSKPKTHKVAKNQTLSSIARIYYDDALAWKKIYKANKSKMKSATDLHEGLVLNLP